MCDNEERCAVDPDMVAEPTETRSNYGPVVMNLPFSGGKMYNVISVNKSTGYHAPEGRGDHANCVARGYDHILGVFAVKQEADKYLDACKASFPKDEFYIQESEFIRAK